MPSSRLLLAVVWRGCRLGLVGRLLPSRRSVGRFWSDVWRSLVRRASARGSASSGGLRVDVACSLWLSPAVSGACRCVLLAVGRPVARGSGGRCRFPCSSAL